MAEAEKDAIIFAAIEFAARAHSGQYRKGTSLPYLIHPLNVARILIEAGAEPEVVAAGILHDSTEDGGVKPAEIEQRFGKRVAAAVAGASEHDKSDTWERRKEKTIAKVAESTDDALLVELADKLDNIRAIRADWENLGEKIWERFNRGKENQSWYYRSLARAFLARAAKSPAKELAAQFANEAGIVFIVK